VRAALEPLWINRATLDANDNGIADDATKIAA
jgi:hypothetical protein